MLPQYLNTRILLLASFFCVIDSSTPGASTLKHVNLLFRHGDRSPNILFPSDINKKGVWPDGLGWLTNIGKRQQFELGQYLHQTYGNFINVKQYDHRQISIQSSAKDRCVVSVLSNLAGLFPPEGRQVWSDDLDLGKLWQPIPIKMRPYHEDNVISLRKPCPRYDQLYTDMFKSKRAKDYESAHQDFFDMLSNNTGFKEKSSLSTTWKIIDPVVCERAHNMTLNDFLNEPGVLDQLDDVQHTSWDMQYLWTEMARLMGGPILQEMIGNMKEAASKEKPGPEDLKMHMYSGHDSTVSALLHAMKVDNRMQPPYASLVMVELHRIDHQDIVKIFYRNDTVSDPQYLVPDGCEDQCKLSTFQKVLADSIPLDWDAECKVDNSAGNMYLPPVLPLALAVMMSILKRLGFV